MGVKNNKIVATIRQALSNDPQDSLSLVINGLILQENQHFFQAALEFRKACKLGSERGLNYLKQLAHARPSFDVYYLLAQHYQEQNQPTEAISVFTEILELLNKTKQPAEEISGYQLNNRINSSNLNLVKNAIRHQLILGTVYLHLYHLTNIKHNLHQLILVVQEINSLCPTDIDYTPTASKETFSEIFSIVTAVENLADELSDFANEVSSSPGSIDSELQANLDNLAINIYWLAAKFIIQAYLEAYKCLTTNASEETIEEIAKELRTYSVACHLKRIDLINKANILDTKANGTQNNASYEKILATSLETANSFVEKIQANMPAKRAYFYYHYLYKYTQNITHFETANACWNNIFSDFILNASIALQEIYRNDYLNKWLIPQGDANYQAYLKYKNPSYLLIALRCFFMAAGLGCTESQIKARDLFDLNFKDIPDYTSLSTEIDKAPYYSNFYYYYLYQRTHKILYFNKANASWNMLFNITNVNPQFLSNESYKQWHINNCAYQAEINYQAYLKQNELSFLITAFRGFATAGSLGHADSRKMIDILFALTKQHNIDFYLLMAELEKALPVGALHFCLQIFADDHNDSRAQLKLGLDPQIPPAVAFEYLKASILNDPWKLTTDLYLLLEELHKKLDNPNVSVYHHLTIDNNRENLHELYYNLAVVYEELPKDSSNNDSHLKSIIDQYIYAILFLPKEFNTNNILDRLLIFSGQHSLKSYVINKLQDLTLTNPHKSFALGKAYYSCALYDHALKHFSEIKTGLYFAQAEFFSDECRCQQEHGQSQSEYYQTLTPSERKQKRKTSLKYTKDSSLLDSKTYSQFAIAMSKDISVASKQTFDIDTLLLLDFAQQGIPDALLKVIRLFLAQPDKTTILTNSRINEEELKNSQTTGLQRINQQMDLQHALSIIYWIVTNTEKQISIYHKKYAVELLIEITKLQLPLSPALQNAFYQAIAHVFCNPELIDYPKQSTLYKELCQQFHVCLEYLGEKALKEQCSESLSLLKNLAEKKHLEAKHFLANTLLANNSNLSNISQEDFILAISYLGDTCYVYQENYHKLLSLTQQGNQFHQALAHLALSTYHTTNPLNGKRPTNPKCHQNAQDQWIKGIDILLLLAKTSHHAGAISELRKVANHFSNFQPKTINLSARKTLKKVFDFITPFLLTLYRSSLEGEQKQQLKSECERLLSFEAATFHIKRAIPEDQFRDPWHDANQHHFLHDLDQSIKNLSRNYNNCGFWSFQKKSQIKVALKLKTQITNALRLLNAGAELYIAIDWHRSEIYIKNEKPTTWQNEKFMFLSGDYDGHILYKGREGAAKLSKKLVKANILLTKGYYPDYETIYNLNLSFDPLASDENAQSSPNISALNN